MPFPNKDTQWKPGQSGNPAGQSRKRRLTDEFARLCESSGATATLAKIWLKKALEGDPKFFAMALDRLEGKVSEAKADEVGGIAEVISEFLNDERDKAKPKPRRSRRTKSDSEA